MTEETYITGKDAPLERSIHHMQSVLAGLGFDVEQAGWLNPVANVWSVHLRDRGCPLLFSNGKGASRKAALASALGEFVERLATGYFFNDFHVDTGPGGCVHDPRERWFAADGETLPEGLMDAAMRGVYDPGGELRPAHLLDFQSDREGIPALPFVRQRTGETVWVPTNLLANLQASNGMAAGNTPAEARTQALSEILERAVKYRIIAEGISLPEVPAPFLRQRPDCLEAIEALEAAGFPVLVRDASLGGRFPVVNVTLLHPQTGGCYASFGAHPSFEVALERTLTELLQGRSLDALGDFHPPSFERQQVADPHNLELHFVDSSGVVGWDFLRSPGDHEFVAWDFADDTRHEAERLVALIHELGHEVYVADHDHLGVPACRIVVPGLSEVYPVDDLWLENTNAARPVRRAVDRLAELDADDCRDLLEAIEHAGLDDMAPVARTLGFAADAGEWGALHFAEFNALLALAAGDREDAAARLDVALATGRLEGARRRRFHALHTLLELALRGDDPAELEPALPRLFGEDELAWARAVLAGETRFPGLEHPPAECDLHRRMLDARARALAAHEARPSGSPGA